MKIYILYYIIYNDAGGYIVCLFDCMYITLTFTYVYLRTLYVIVTSNQIYDAPGGTC